MRSVVSCSSTSFPWLVFFLEAFLQWGAADAGIKVPSVENTDLKGSAFKARSRSVYSHTCCAYCQWFLPCLFLPFQSIHLHFFQNLSWVFPVLVVTNTSSCVGLQNKIGHPAGCRFPCWGPSEYKKAKKTWLVVWWLVKWINLEIEWSLCSALMQSFVVDWAQNVK